MKNDNAVPVLPELSHTEKTPYYFFDTGIFKRTIRAFKAMQGPGRGLCYAMKANPFLVRVAEDAADRIEVCSFGEYKICRELGIRPDKLLISGVVKLEEDLKEILDWGAGRCAYTAESKIHLDYLAKWSRDHQTTLMVYPRLTSGNQFGMDEKEVLEVLQRCKNEPYLIPAGLHYYPGTMKKKTDTCRKEIEKLDRFLCMAKEQGIEISELEYGPGIPADYFSGKEFPEAEAFMRVIEEAISQMQWHGKVILEMGRALAASCGIYCTRAAECKVNQGISYVLADGGIHQLAYDGQIRGMYHPYMEVYREDACLFSNLPGREKPAEEGSAVTICGSLCTVNDVLVSGMPIGEIRKDDRIVFYQTGAYCAFEGMSLFLSHELPDIWVKEGETVYAARSGKNAWNLNMKEAHE